MSAIRTVFTDTVGKIFHGAVSNLHVGTCGHVYTITETHSWTDEAETHEIDGHIVGVDRYTTGMRVQVLGEIVKARSIDGIGQRCDVGSYTPAT